MNNKRPAVPNDVSRQLRKEAGFGCAKCGFPFCEYHHILPYSQENHFRVEDMLALCPNCHHEANIGAISEKEQRGYKDSPFNISKGHAEGQLKINQDFAAFHIGTITIINDGFYLNADDEEIIKLQISETGKVELSTIIYDENGSLLLLIERNNWVSGDISLWDIEYKFNYFKMRTKNGKIDLEIDAREEPFNIKGEFWKNNTRIKANQSGLHFNIRNQEGQGHNGLFMNSTFIGGIIEVFSKHPEGDGPGMIISSDKRRNDLKYQQDLYNAKEKYYDKKGK